LPGVPQFSHRLSGTKSRLLKFPGKFLIAIRRIAAFAGGLVHGNCGTTRDRTRCGHPRG
jgi:hypothetical protein